MRSTTRWTTWRNGRPRPWSSTAARTTGSSRPVGSPRSPRYSARGSPRSSCIFPTRTTGSSSLRTASSGTTPCSTGSTGGRKPEVAEKNGPALPRISKVSTEGSRVAGSWGRATLGELMAHVYGSPIDPTGWSEAMRLIARGIGASTVGIHIHSPDGRDASTIALHGEPPPALLRRYESYFAERNVWLTEGAAKLKSGAVLTGEELCSEEALLRSEFYNDFLRPLRLRWSVFVIVEAAPDPLTYLWAARPSERRAFGAAERRRLGSITPHLVRAMRIHAKLEATLSHERAAAEVMDRLPLGIFLLDSRGRVVQMNAAARSIVERKDALRRGRGVLMALETRADVQLQRMIFGAGAAGTGRNLTLGGTCALPREKGGHPLSAMVAPTGVTGIFPSSRRASVVVLVEEPVQRPPLPFITFSKSFKLSQAEALLAQRLLAGLSLRQAAEELGIWESTARSHLKRVFVKTGARRQSDLILRALTHHPEGSPYDS